MTVTKIIHYYNSKVSLLQYFTISNMRQTMSSNGRTFSVVSSSPSTVIILSLAILINKIFSAPVTQANHYPLNTLEYLHGAREKTEEWKENRWNNWFQQLEEEWTEFNYTLENEKEEWIRGNEKEWDNFLTDVEKKWIHLSRNIDNEYKRTALAESLTWNETMWRVWINTEGRDFIEKEWRQWITNKESYLYSWVSREWVQWKDEKIQEWKNNKWKLEENEYWEKYEKKMKSGKLSKFLNLKEKEKWLKWKDRNRREKEQWLNWVQTKDDIYINSKWEKWKKWKNYKRNLFYKWVDAYVNKWIHEKQWYVLVNEVKELTLQKDDSM
ncbi:tryptophan-rich protein [Plasmodium ovale]|uniref:Tryptophan-rich protein n=1 Tax=Plasmodium ovale TaxID=36330 RepID=A0A1D3JD51_PLAOA|nr:tryptophan-rich protein [Plasmodium ovale]